LPYIATDEMHTLAVSKHEPHLALDGGADGLDLIRSVLQQVPIICHSGAVLLLESERRYRDLGLKVTAFSAGEAESSVLYARYRVENARIDRVRMSLMLALRPFQVNPPWQSLNMMVGTTPIRSVRAEGRAIRVDARTLIPLAPPTRLGAATYDQGAITDYLLEGRVPSQQGGNDPFGYASAALQYELDLPAGASRTIAVSVCFIKRRRRGAT